MRDRRAVESEPFGGLAEVPATYTRDVFAATQHWTEAHHLFPDRPESLLGYDEAALVLSSTGCEPGAVPLP